MENGSTLPSTSGIKRADSIESLFSDIEIPEKKLKRGIVYVSFIPQGMNPTILRKKLSAFAPIGRIFMQVAEENAKKEKKRKKMGSLTAPDSYSEGWVEFLKKVHAKRVAALLHNQPMGGKKRDKFHDCLWNLKYLSRFKWIHLVERLNYEKALTRQRMQNEISQAKRVANFFKETVEKEERQRKRLKKQKGPTDNGTSSTPYTFAQRETVEEKKAKKNDVEEGRETFLKSLFS